jgi:hypothetical protein
MMQLLEQKLARLRKPLDTIQDPALLRRQHARERVVLDVAVDGDPGVHEDGADLDFDGLEVQRVGWVALFRAQDDPSVFGGVAAEAALVVVEGFGVVGLFGRGGFEFGVVLVDVGDDFFSAVVV